MGSRGSSSSSLRRGALAAALAVAAAGLGLLGGASASAGPATGCPSLPGGLSPKGKGANAYTMMLRVNKLNNVADYGSGLRTRLRARDIFVVNTRFKNSTPEEWTAIASALRQSFPCNRVVSLNGLAPDPAQPGYQWALTDHPGLWGLALDWEAGDWNQGRKQNPSIPPWSNDFGVNRGRIAKRLTTLGATSSAALGGPGRRTGVVPAYYAAWDYGLIARTVDRKNALRRKGRRGFQVVQSQGHCSESGSAAFYGLANRLFLQYRPKKRVKKVRRRGKVRKIVIKVKPRGVVRTMAMEVSFSDSPDPSDPRPVASLSPGAASKCTRAGLKRGFGAFLYWAHPGSIRALLGTRRICALRPPC